MARRKGAKGGPGSVGTPATVVLDRAGIAYEVRTYDGIAPPRSGNRDGYGAEVAAALGLDPATVFKTLIAEVDGALTVGVVPVEAHLDLKALAAAAGGKRAVMADPAVAERSSGYVVGGISPLGQRRRLPTFVDSSAQGLAAMWVSAGQRGAQIAVAPADLVRVVGARLAPVARR